MSKPHGEPEFYYRPNHVNGDAFRDNYDRIFRKKEPQPEIRMIELPDGTKGSVCDPAYRENSDNSTPN